MKDLETQKLTNMHGVSQSHNVNGGSGEMGLTDYAIQRIAWHYCPRYSIII